MDPFSFNIESDPSTVPLDLLPTLVAMARSDKPEDVFQGVMLIRKLLYVERNAPIQEVVDTGVAEVLAKCMANENADLQFEASRALSNLASGDTSHAHYIINLGVVPLWVGHLSSGNDKCQEHALWALGNVAGEGSKFRNYVLKEGAMQPVLDLICSCGDDKSTLLKNAVWALSNLCRFKPPPAIEYIIPAVPVLTKLLQHPDPEVSIDSIWTLSYIADGPEGARLVIDSGVVPTVVQMLSAGNIKYHLPAIRVIGHICVVKLCPVAINAGCLPPMKSLLDTMNAREVRKDAARALSNIGAGNEAQIQAMIDAGLLPAIISTVGTYEHEVQEEAVWACANIANNGSSQQISLLVECGALEALCEVLRSTGAVKIIVVAMEAILSFLESGAELVDQGQCTNNLYVEKVRSIAGIRAIADLMSHRNCDIQCLARRIMSTYWQNETHDTTQPVVDDEQPPPMQRPKEGNYASEEDEDEADGNGFWDS